MNLKETGGAGRSGESERLNILNKNISLLLFLFLVLSLEFLNIIKFT